MNGTAREQTGLEYQIWVFVCTCVFIEMFTEIKVCSLLPIQWETATFWVVRAICIDRAIPQDATSGRTEHTNTSNGNFDRIHDDATQTSIT